MKVLFLDIDGVLNGHEKWPGSPYATIRGDCIKRLNRVVKATACKIVVSSAWRYMMLKRNRRAKPPMTLLGFQYMLHTHGLFFGGMDGVIGHTVSDEEIPERGKQILAWLKGKDVESWAVVDDDPMAMELGKHAGRLVQTDGKHGLRDRDARALIRLLSPRGEKGAGG